MWDLGTHERLRSLSGSCQGSCKVVALFLSSGRGYDGGGDGRANQALVVHESAQLVLWDVETGRKIASAHSGGANPTQGGAREGWGSVMQVLSAILVPLGEPKDESSTVEHFIRLQQQATPPSPPTPPAPALGGEL